MKLTDVKMDRVFIGSCTNGRIEDLRAAAAVAQGKKVAAHVSAIVVPGSGLVKEQAEEEGLDKVFLEAGFRMARAGLLDVPGHERRQARSPASAAPPPPTAISKAARAAADAPI